MNCKHPTFCIALAHSIPHFDGARDIAACDIKARGRETGDGSLCGMLSVLFADGRIIDGTEEDRLSGCVGDALALGIGREERWLAPYGRRSCRPDGICRASECE